MKDSKKANRVRGRLPVKKSINLALVGQKKTRVTTVLLAVILIIIAAAAIGKFLVMDRLAEVDREEQKVRDLRTELSAANAKLDSFGELQETYAHYTFADMTGEEMRRVERSDVVDLIERVVLPAAELNSWNVKENQLTLNVTMDTLQDTNLLAQILNDEAMVEFATVKNAVTNEIKKEEPIEEVPVGEDGAEPSEGEAPAEENPVEENPGEEPSGEGETEGESEVEEEKELLYNVTAQIIVYLTIAEKEG